MANLHHAHVHRRRGLKEAWDDFTSDVDDLVGETRNSVHKKANGPSTVYETVYTTMEPTFTEEVAGYSTVSSDDNASATGLDEATASVTADAADSTDSADSTGSLLPQSIVMTSGSDATQASTLALATTAAAVSSNTASSNTASTTSSAASSTSTASSSSSGTSGAAKAGIAIGVLGGLLVLGLLVWFAFSKRRKQMDQQRAADDEKVNGAMMGGAAAGAGMGMAAAAASRRDSVQTMRTTAEAPQLQLRPVTQFMPNFGERRSSKGAAMALAMGPSPSNSQAARAVGNSPWERPMTSQSNHQDNPFGNHAEHLDPNTERAPLGPTFDDPHPNNPFNAPENVVGMAHTTDSAMPPSPIGTALSVGVAAGAAGAAAGASLTRKQSIRKDAPQALDLTKAGSAAAFGAVPIPASPAGTEFSMTSVDPGQSPGPSKSAAAIAAAGGPPQSTVHRVQLDFQPTMDDEMELKTGQLVRLLHAYDDGWALCIRLDRSQQGVCPRTCLSERPVKPRPNGPPGPGPRNGPPGAPNGPPRGPPRGPGPNFPPGQRPQSPAMMRPQSPAMMRPQSPAMMRPQSPAMMRPQSPAMMRPQSPAMMRPQSPAGMGRPQSPGPRGPYNGRPQSPGPRGPYNGRPQSPGPRGPPNGRPQSPGPRAMSPGPGQRSQSPGPRPNGGRRMTPPGPSPMNPASGNSGNSSNPQSPQGPIGRKPVPGQAY